MRRTILLTSLILMLVAFGTAFASSAGADSIGPITFEPPTYAVGNINGQNGWMKLNPAYDVNVASVSSYPAASAMASARRRYGCPISSPAAASATRPSRRASPRRAGEASGLANHFDSTFMFGSALATYQPGMHVSVSPDNGSGARMSYLRFDDMSDGVHVFFDDVEMSGPCPIVFLAVPTSSRRTSPR